MFGYNYTYPDFEALTRNYLAAVVVTIVGSTMARV